MWAEPAIAPSARYAQPVVAALYGVLELHGWRDPHVDSLDLYGLFYSRSSAMGWLTEAVEGAVGGFWGMNEAEYEARSGGSPYKIAWCQVDFTHPDAAGRVPLQPMLTCLGDAVARIGTPQISAIQIALPTVGARPASSESALRALIDDSSWFTSSDPRSTTGFRLTLDGGQRHQIHEAAPGMLEWMSGIGQVVASFDSLLPQPDNEIGTPDPGFEGDMWPGPPQHRATMRGTLAEWSLDALGWLAAFVAEAASRLGVSVPWTLTVKREDTSNDNLGST